jgi:hypothetical protein
MDLRTLHGAVGLVGLLCLSATDQEPLKEKLQTLQALQARAAELQDQVVEAPEDRALYRTLLEAGLQQYELIHARGRFPEDRRESILDLKLVMEDMYSIQQAVSETGLPVQIDGNELASRLRTTKVPPGHRRSVPLIDPWGTPYRFFVYPANGQYKIVSAGRGKRFDPADLGISEQELRQAPEKRNATMSDDIVFIDGRNFTRMFDYPMEAQTFLYTRCEPADEPQPERVRCW